MDTRGVSSFKDGYSDKPDEYILTLVKKGDKDAQDYIFDKYKYIVRAKSRVYFLIGADTEDIIQEGMIGLYKAIRDFQPDKNVSFRVFAEVCIQRQMITAIKAATRQKHMPLNSYISLNKPVFYEDGDNELLDFLQKGGLHNPEEIIIGQEEKLFIESGIEKALSKFEHKVLYFYLQGGSYEEISNFVKKPQKSIDNALQRIKRKITGLGYGKDRNKRA